MKEIDARGKPCPQPVIMAKKEIAAGVRDFLITVDNEPAVQNLTRQANSAGFALQVVQQGDKQWQLHFSAGDGVPEAIAGADVVPALQEASASGPSVLLLSRETFGHGDDELGRTLLQMYLYTLTEQEPARPDAVVMLNGGVRLCTEHAQCIEHLQTLAARGTTVLACGACLNFFGLADKLAVGTVSNMYDIAEVLAAAGKVIAP